MAKYLVLAAVLAGAPLDSPERDDAMGTVRYADGSPIPEELQPFAAGLAALQRRADSTPEFTVLALGSTSEGGGSTDASCEGTAAEFLEFLQSDSDRAFIESLMKPEAEPAKFASWIAPPKVGIDNKPGNFEYVKIA